MNWLFTIIICVILIGGGLLIVLIKNENDKNFTKYFLWLFALTGLVVIVYGAILQATNQVIFSTGKGPVEGWQLIITGVGLSFISSLVAIKKHK